MSSSGHSSISAQVTGRSVPFVRRTFPRHASGVRRADAQNVEENRRQLAALVEEFAIVNAGGVAESAQRRSRAMKMTRLIWSAAAAAAVAFALNAAPLHG